MFKYWHHHICQSSSYSTSMVQKHHYSPCWAFSWVQRFLPEALKHSASRWVFPTFNIYHCTHTVAHHPLLAFTFSFHPFCVLFFCHLPPNLLNPPRSPILMRRKTETTRIEGRRWQPFLSRGCGQPSVISWVLTHPSFSTLSSFPALLC